MLKYIAAVPSVVPCPFAKVHLPGSSVAMALVRVGEVTTSSCDWLGTSGVSSRECPSPSSEASLVSWDSMVALRAAALVVEGMVPFWPLAIIRCDRPMRSCGTLPAPAQGPRRAGGRVPGPPLLILLVALLAIPYPYHDVASGTRCSSIVTLMPKPLKV